MFPPMVKRWKPSLQEPEPARLYAAVSFDDLQECMNARKELESLFGGVDYETDTLLPRGLKPRYGPVPRRGIRFMSFQRPVGREELVDITKRVLSIEMKYQHDGRPLVEVDMGYVTRYTVIRSSLEDDFHRIYLHGGVYGETLYYFERNSFRPLVHTPEFYRQSETTTLFNDLRLIHVSQ